MYAMQFKDKILLLSELREDAIKSFEFNPDDLPNPPNDGNEYELIVNFETESFSLFKVESIHSKTIEELSTEITELEKVVDTLMEGLV